ncbi:MAG TPA: hypothetical protein VK112_10050 [Fodinibius sp.]|nr:hypothetical protein [Fodinibius sp.]
MHSQNILIIEDHPSVSAVLARMVRSMGHEVIGEVQTGEEAIRWTLTEPVIFASTSPTLLEQEQRRNNPCSAFLTKPFTAEELATVIGQLATEGGTSEE